MKETKLFRKDFTLIVIGQIISLFGNAILRFALPLYLLQTTGSAALFGMVTACSFLPMIVLSLLGGVIADRVNKRNIMVILDFCTAALILIFSLLIGKVAIIPLFIIVLMILYGISGAYQPAVQASIPAVVSIEKLLSGNAVVNQVNALAGLLGPVIGGVLYSAFGIKLILGVSIVCFIVSAVMEIFIKIPFVKREVQGNVVQIVARDLNESYSYVKKEQPVFFKVALLLALFNMIISALLVVGIPVLLVEKLKISDTLFGLSQGAMALGGLTGGIIAGMLGSRLKIKKIYLTLLGCALSVVPIGFVVIFSAPVMTKYLIITAMSFLCMVASTMFSVQALSFVQMKIPQELLGKVIAAIMAVAICAHPIGQATYGVLFERFEAMIGYIMLISASIGCIMAMSSKKIFNKFE